MEEELSKFDALIQAFELDEVEEITPWGVGNGMEQAVMLDDMQNIRTAYQNLSARERCDLLADKFVSFFNKQCPENDHYENERIVYSNLNYARRYIRSEEKKVFDIWNDFIKTREEKRLNESLKEMNRRK